MVCLYLSQGVVFGANNSIPTLLLGYRDVSATEQSLLTLPAYSFALKFLWAPLIDSVYISKRTRRPMWIIGCQVVASLLLFLIRAEWTSSLREAESSVALTVALSTLMFVIASQDIAVDAWAVEGVDPSRSSMAASSQSIGLLCGFVLCKSFFVLQEYGFVAKENSAEGLLSIALGFVFSVTVLTACYYLFSETCKVALDECMQKEIEQIKEKRAEERKAAKKANSADNNNNNNNNRSSQGKKKKKNQKKDDVDGDDEDAVIVVGADSTIEAIKGVVNDMITFKNQPFFFDVLLFLSLRGVVWAGGALVATAQQKRFGVTPAFSSGVYLALLPLQFWVSSYAPSIIRGIRASSPKMSVLQIWFWTGSCWLASEILNWAIFTLSASATSEYRFQSVVPAAIGSMVVSTFAFNAGATFTAELAALMPHSTGTMMTLIFSLMNLGMQWPRSLALYAAGRLAEVYPDVADAAGSNSTTASQKVGEPLFVIHAVLWSSVATGLLLQFLVLAPCIGRIHAAQEKQKEEKAKRD